MVWWLCTIQVYIILELILLLFIGVSFILKLVWKGPKDFLKSRNVLTVSTKHTRCHCENMHGHDGCMQALILLIMFVEALAIT